MSSYRSAGGLDDQYATDGDVGFVGMNLRLLPNQLQAGEVSLSQNGRIDGYWQCRKGVVLKSGALSSSNKPLKLPFYLLDLSIAISTAVRASNVITLTLDSGHGLVTGTVLYVTLGDVDEADPLTGTDDVPPGTYLMTVTGTDELTFAHAGADETLTVSGTYGFIWTEIDDDSVENIWGASTLSDPAGVLSESIVMATNLAAKRVALDTYAVTSVPYPSGATLGAEVNMMQTFDRIYLFRPGGNQAWEWVFNGRPIESAAQAGTTTVTMKVAAHGLTAGDTIVISGLTGGTPANGTFTVLAVNSADEFTYTFTSSQNQTFGVTNAVCKAAGFTKVLGGPYSQPQQFAIAASAVAVSDSLLTATVSSNTTIKAGDFVQVHYTEIEELKHLTRQYYQVVEATSTTIKFYVPAGAFTGSSSDKFDFGGRTSVGGGFIHNPASPWATYFQRRLWTPFYYSLGGTSTAPTYASRNIQDEIVVSDILDGNTYDQIFSQFKITGGTSDYLMAMHPFYNDFLVVLMRNSLHLIRGTQGSLEDTVVTELTREVGCLARKSVVGYGNTMFFLSDNGVYGAEFMDEYNLRGVQEPLSKNIQPLIDRINKNLAEKAVGIFFNNRYYLAVPLDSAAGANDAQGNNAILVFNVLNKAWESIDTFENNTLNVISFHINQENERNNLYAVSNQGGVHLMEGSFLPVDTISTSPTGDSQSFDVNYLLKTRGYQLGNYERKKFSRAQVQCEADSSNCDALILFETEDPDTNSFEVGSIVSGIGQDLPPGETANLRFRLGNPRGLYGVLTFTGNTSGSSLSGRPKVNSIAIDGAVTNRQTISQY
jgi:hypothetical protein